MDYSTNKEKETITVKFIKHIFSSKDSSYRVSLFLDSEDEEIKTVGHIDEFRQNLYYKLTGYFFYDSTYGKEFQILDYEEDIELRTKKSTIDYLCEANSIGPKTAKRIYDILGANCTELIVENKDILDQVPRLGNKQKESLYRMLYEEKDITETKKEFRKLDIFGETYKKIYDRYNDEALAEVKKNPYNLIDTIKGIGFKKADHIAMKLNISLTDPRRIKAAIFAAINNYLERDGGTYIFKDNLKNSVNSLLIEKYYINIEIEYDKYLNELINEEKLIEENNKIYPIALYVSEVYVAKKIKVINDNYICNLEDKINNLNLNTNDIYYTPKQKEAIKTALKSPITVITGGPGTGKTTIIESILYNYGKIHNINKEDLKNYVNIMAPTGRAAKRIRDILNFNATTIHKALGYDYTGVFTHDRYNPLSHSLIIIDESSMIDIMLARDLFQAIKNDSQVVIVGDVDQLPSVGQGQFLKDLIDSNTCNIVRLDQIHRQAKDSKIIELANKINTETINNLDLYDPKYKDFDTNIYNLKLPEIIDEILNITKYHINENNKDLINDIQILIPKYRGDVGVDIVNKSLQNYFIKNKKEKIIVSGITYYPGDKVIQTENNINKDVMNGDIGYIKNIIFNKGKESGCNIVFDERIITYDKTELNQIKLAYSITIHKSQGSEFPIVIMPLDRSYGKLLNKQLLYTGITRAKQLLYLIGDLNLIIDCSHNRNKDRTTSFKEKLLNEFNK